ncbi:MAG: class I SAM-dependent methyltransferase [Chloroflexi bacterium]|nr:class I SAM-dependent methyltransferase [Chloroflexota bacterium]
MEPQRRRTPVYDRIGRGYSLTRRPDSRIARRILDALGDVGSVVNVGAGTGSYEPAGLQVVAVEPSQEMIAQRVAAAPVVRAVAESLPFPSRSFDAAMAVLTIHHWGDWRAGVSEMRRVARSRIVLLTWDLDSGAGFWLLEYFPGILDLDRGRFPPFGDLLAATGGEPLSVPVPHDCSDGFLGAWWRRPSAYLDDTVRSAMSGFALLPDDDVARGLARLSADTRSGEWERRFGALRDLEELDLGYRLVVADAT